MTALAGPAINKYIGSVAGRVVAKALIGGTVSHLTGGKFANGAAMSAFQSALTEVSGGNRVRGKRGVIGPKIPRLARLAMTQAENAVSEIRKHNYKDLKSLVEDVADVLQPITNNLHTELGARIYKNGGYYEIGSIISDGQVCNRDATCGVTTSLSRNLNGEENALAAHFHTHPDNSIFSTNDLQFAWSDGGRFNRDIMTYVSMQDMSIVSFDTWLVGHQPGAKSWADYLNYSFQER